PSPQRLPGDIAAFPVAQPDDVDERTLRRVQPDRPPSADLQLIIGLVRAELAREAPAESGQTPQELATAILARAGIDPASAEHRAAAAKARTALRSAGRARSGAA